MIRGRVVLEIDRLGRHAEDGEKAAEGLEIVVLARRAGSQQPLRQVASDVIEGRTDVKWCKTVGDFEFP